MSDTVTADQAGTINFASWHSELDSCTDETISTSNYIDLTQSSTSNTTTLTYEQHHELLNKQLTQYKQLLLNNIQKHIRSTTQSVNYESTHSLVKLKQLLHDTVRAYHSVEGSIYDDYRSLQQKQLKYNKLCVQRNQLSDECSELHKMIEYRRSKIRKQSIMQIAQQQSQVLDGNAMLTNSEITAAKLHAIKLQYEEQLNKIDYNTQQLQRYTDQSNDLLQTHSKQLQAEQNEYNFYNAQLQQLLTVDAASRHTREFKLKQLMGTQNGLQQYQTQIKQDIETAQNNTKQLNEQIAATNQSIDQCTNKINTVVFTHNALIDSVKQQWTTQHKPIAHCCSEVVQSFAKLLGMYDTAIQNIQMKYGSQDTNQLLNNVLYRLFCERYSVSKSQIHELNAICHKVIETINAQGK